jgi:hypothetical protein
VWLCDCVFVCLCIYVFFCVCTLCVWRRPSLVLVYIWRVVCACSCVRVFIRLVCACVYVWFVASMFVCLSLPLFLRFPYLSVFALPRVLLMSFIPLPVPVVNVYVYVCGFALALSFERPLALSSYSCSLFFLALAVARLLRPYSPMSLR